MKHTKYTFSLQVFGFNHVLSAMFHAQSNATTSAQQSTATNGEHTYLNKANTKIKEAAKTASVQVKAQAEQIYQAYSVKN